MHKNLNILPLSLFSFILISTLLLSCRVRLTNNASGELASSFETPPLSDRPGAYWCWLNGNMSKESITRDLEAMNSKGISRAEIWDVLAHQRPEMIAAGAAFLSDESVALIKHTIAEGKRLNIQIGMIASSGWNAGGSWVTPDWASKALYFSSTLIEGPKKVSIELPFPVLPQECPMKADGTPAFYNEVAVLAVPYREDKTIDEITSVINVTPQFSDGKLNWEPPPGKWNIIRFLCSNTGQKLIVPTPNSNGLFIDFLDPDATKRHLKYILDRLGITPENAAEKGLDYLEFDSMELSESTPWTDSIPDIFWKMQGYPIERYLPVFAGWKLANQQDQQFLYDFRKTISDQLIFSHYTTGSEFLKPYHTELVAEAGGPGPPISNCPVDALKALGNVSVPRGEFWIEHRNMFLVKEIASAAHIYGKTIVDAESFTTWRRFEDSPFEMKKHVDRAYAEGLNRVTFHTFASTNPEDGLPGRVYHAGIDMNHGTTWWEKSKPFMDYLSRCNYMLRQGLFVADACYFYGDHAPNFFPLHHDVPEKPRLPGLDGGYDFDVVNSDVIMNRMSVNKGRITLPDGMSYALMILPDQKEMPLQILEKIEAMVYAGASVVGPKPLAVPGLGSSDYEKRRFNDIADKLWGNIDGINVKEHVYGKGKIWFGMTPEEVLKAVGIDHDFSFNGTPVLDYLHRSTETHEIYFIRNESGEWARGKAQFRVTGMVPELWNPATGSQNRIDIFSEEKNHIAFDVNLPPHGSAFVVFNKHKRKLPPLESGKIITEQPLDAPWAVTFPSGWGAPPEVIFDKLQSWADFDDAGIKYFSGTATYRKTFTLTDENKGSKCYLNLGEVRELAEVYVNGKSAGILWKKPFIIDISPLLKSGENELKIEIVNLWANRLSGDLLLKPEERFCHTNFAWSESIVLPSGLLGPVKLEFQRK